MAYTANVKMGSPAGNNVVKSEAEKKAARIAAHHKRWATIKARRAADKDIDIETASIGELVAFVEFFGLLTDADKRFTRDNPPNCESF